MRIIANSRSVWIKAETGDRRWVRIGGGTRGEEIGVASLEAGEPPRQAINDDMIDISKYFPRDTLPRAAGPPRYFAITFAIGAGYRQRHLFKCNISPSNEDCSCSKNVSHRYAILFLGLAIRPVFISLSPQRETFRYSLYMCAFIYVWGALIKNSAFDLGRSPCKIGEIEWVTCKRYSSPVKFRYIDRKVKKWWEYRSIKTIWANLCLKCHRPIS